MTLASMKIDPREYEGCSPSNSQYGYGTCISLTDDQCKALGITNALPAGTIVAIEAQGIVESVTECVDKDSESKAPEIRMSVQITDMYLEPIGTAKDAAKTLYGKGE